MKRIVLLTIFVAGCASLPPESRPGEAPAPHFVLLTYNVNFALVGDPPALEAIRSSGADLVLLQETNPGWEAALEPLRDDYYPYQQFVHHGSTGGLAVLSRRPFESRKVLPPPPQGWFPAWLIRAETPLGPVDVLNVHLRPQLGEDGGIVSAHFETPPIREEEMENYLDRLEADAPTILAGDFNEEPGDEALARAAERGFLRVGIDEDTWHWKVSFVTFHRRFDHVLHDPRLTPVDARVLDAGRSDHLPVRVVFALDRARPGAVP